MQDNMQPASQLMWRCRYRIMCRTAANSTQLFIIILASQCNQIENRTMFVLVHGHRLNNTPVSMAQPAAKSISCAFHTYFYYSPILTHISNFQNSFVTQIYVLYKGPFRLFSQYSFLNRNQVANSFCVIVTIKVMVFKSTFSSQ